MNHEQMRDLSQQAPREKTQEAKRILDTAPWAGILLDELAVHSEWNMQHCLRVGTIVHAVAEAAQRDEAMIHKLTLAGFVHDVGKICMPHQIIDNVSGQLTAEDWSTIHQHPTYSYNVIKPHDAFVAQIVLGHHRIQKNPYPSIEGWEDTSPEMQFYWRIVSIADVTDAYLSPRPNSPRIPTYEEARVRLTQQFGEDRLLMIAVQAHKSLNTGVESN